MLCLLCAAVELGQYASLDYLDYLLIIRTVTGTGSEGAGLAAGLGQCRRKRQKRRALTAINFKRVLTVT